MRNSRSDAARTGYSVAGQEEMQMFNGKAEPPEGHEIFGRRARHETRQVSPKKGAGRADPRVAAKALTLGGGVMTAALLTLACYRSGGEPGRVASPNLRPKPAVPDNRPPPTPETQTVTPSPAPSQTQTWAQLHPDVAERVVAAVKFAESCLARLDKDPDGVLARGNLLTAQAWSRAAQANSLGLEREDDEDAPPDFRRALAEVDQAWNALSLDEDANARQISRDRGAQLIDQGTRRGSPNRPYEGAGRMMRDGRSDEPGIRQIENDLAADIKQVHDSVQGLKASARGFGVSVDD